MVLISSVPLQCRHLCALPEQGRGRIGLDRKAKARFGDLVFEGIQRLRQEIGGRRRG